jgi:hypothetical protein
LSLVFALGSFFVLVFGLRFLSWHPVLCRSSVFNSLGIITIQPYAIIRQEKARQDKTITRTSTGQDNLSVADTRALFSMQKYESDLNQLEGIITAQLSRLKVV